MKLKISRQIFKKEKQMFNFMRNPSTASRVVVCGQTGG